MFDKIWRKRDKFQFHNGSIKSEGATNSECPFVWFQFHNGSIKRVDGEVIIKSAGEFQFHNGSIKSRAQPRALSAQLWFQFHNGSIKSPTNQQKILYRTRTISTRRKLPLLPKVVNVRLCKIHGELTTARCYASNLSY